MTPTSLFRSGRYAADWIKDFYDQAGIWWGPDPQEPGVHPARADAVARLCGPGPWRILELGAGSGASAAELADRGHAVTAVELSPVRANDARQLARQPRKGSLAVVEGDFYTVPLDGRFDVVCCWEVFGLGSDADQRRLLRRIAEEWLAPELRGLAPGGSVLVDVYCPFHPARQAATEVLLPPLKGVPGSVEMINRCHFDPLHSRWIDEWQPTQHPELALAQAIRCYSPPELLLLLEGTGLKLTHLEVDGVPLDFTSDQISPSGPLLDAWSYFVALKAG